MRSLLRSLLRSPSVRNVLAVTCCPYRIPGTVYRIPHTSTVNSWPAPVRERPDEGHRRTAWCFLKPSTSPPGSVIGGPLASSAGWGGRLPPTYSDWHETQELGSIYPIARRSACSNMQQTFTNPPWGTRNEYLAYQYCSIHS